MRDLSLALALATPILAISYFYGEYLENKEPDTVAYIFDNLEIRKYQIQPWYFVENYGVYWKMPAGPFFEFKKFKYYIVRDQKKFDPPEFGVKVYREKWQRCKYVMENGVEKIQLLK